MATVINDIPDTYLYAPEVVDRLSRRLNLTTQQTKELARQVNIMARAGRRVPVWQDGDPERTIGHIVAGDQPGALDIVFDPPVEHGAFALGLSTFVSEETRSADEPPKINRLTIQALMAVDYTQPTTEDVADEEA